MINTSVLVVLGGVFIFALGALVGATWVESVRDARSRRQADRQHALNAQSRALREQRELLHERQEAFEEEMRWQAKRQAGLVVIDYEEAN